MQVCNKCKSQCSDTSKYCPVCGEVLLLPSNAYSATASPEMSASSYIDTDSRRQICLLNIFYGVLLFFVVIPIMFPKYSFSGFGNFGYGLRQQISAFANLADPAMSTALLLLIYSLVILLIVAVIFAACFSMVSIIMLVRSNSRRQPINYKLLKIFTSFVFYAFTLIFLVTIPYLTFSFICAYLLSFFALLVSYRQNFAKDLLLRKGNEENNSKATRIFMTSILFAFCFTPIYYTSLSGKISYNCFDFVKGLFGASVEGVAEFLRVMSIVLLLVSLVLFCFSVIRYLFIGEKKKLYFIDLIALSLATVFLILIGAFIRIENLRVVSSIVAAPPELSTIYYIYLSLVIAVLIIPLIQKGVDFKNAKKSS